MKKLISLIMAVLCIFSFVACGGTTSEGLTEIKPSGGGIELSELEEFLSARQQTHIEKDMAKYEERKEQWFEVNLIKYTAGGSSARNWQTTMTVNGKLVFVNDREILFEADFLVESINVENGKEKKTTDKSKVVLVNEMLYIDSEKKTIDADGAEQTESIKVKGVLEKIYASDFTVALNKVLFIKGNDWDYYGVGVFDLLAFVKEIEFQSKTANYYKDGNTVYLDIKAEEINSDESEEVIYQSKIEFEKNSAIVKACSLFYRDYKENFVNTSSGEVKSNYNEIKIRIDLKKISSGIINTPNAEDYQEI